MTRFSLFRILLMLSTTLFAEGGTPSPEDILHSDIIGWNQRIPSKDQPEVKGDCMKSPPKPKNSETPKTRPTSHIEIGANYTYAHVSPSSEPSSQGSLGGAQASYEFQTISRIYVAVLGRWSMGNTTGTRGSRHLLMFDAQERLGYTWGSWRKGRMFTFFAGIGDRYNGENVKASGSSVKFNYNEFYLPIGFLLKGRINSVFSMGFNFQWMPQVFPTVTIVPLKGARWILNCKVANFRAELPFLMCCSKKNHLMVVLKPFFEFWQDGHTSAKTQLGTTLHIPGNTYLFPGVDLNLRYSF